MDKIKINGQEVPLIHAKTKTIISIKKQENCMLPRKSGKLKESTLKTFEGMSSLHFQSLIYLRKQSKFNI